jgi:4-methylaminobutanoate oxidase (formaldehyde-forming)
MASTLSVGTLPRRVDLVVIGAGALGASIAWHARREGLSVLLLDRGDVASGATSRAAALLTRARSKPALMPLVARTYEAIPELERALGESLGLRRSGTLYGAASAAHVAALRELVRVAQEAGIAVEWVGPGEARKRAPWLEVDALEACAHVPEDGFLDPHLLASAYARAAARDGAVVRSRVEVSALVVDGARVAGVQTSGGPVESGAVALAAGAWSGALAWKHGVALPMAPVRSQYWITEPSPLFPREQPIAVLPDAGVYARPALGALLFGLRESASHSVDARDLGPGAAGPEGGDPGGWDALVEGGHAFARLCPALNEVGIDHHVAGFSTYTPDGMPLVGAVPGLEGLLVATGCCGAGIAASGGAGLAVAALAAGRASPLELAAFDPGRFGWVDPFGLAFRARCERARSRITPG